MEIKQFKDEPLAHYSYALVSEGEMAIVDPARNPIPYYQYAEQQNARIVAVLETHPHADFVSSHLQIQQETGAKIYINPEVGPAYEYQPLEDGQRLKIGKAEIHALATPGHSPDSLSYYATDGQQHVLFSGDTLFIGDVGRPDLREKAGNQTALRKELAAMMYQTIQTKFNDLPDETIIYPAHGAGSLCGKNLSDADSSTLGQERQFNWAFKKQDQETFVAEILKDQPFIPHYFGFNVELNRKGAAKLSKALAKVPILLDVQGPLEEHLVVDTRDAMEFKKGHLPGSINIMGRSETDKFETWLGSVVEPDQKFYLVVDRIENLEELLERTAKIGYENQVVAALTLDLPQNEPAQLNLQDFRDRQENYHILDVRNESEVRAGKIFDQSLHIPLPELNQRIKEVPTDKPVVVHCAGGYRSAAGSSLVQRQFPELEVYDLGENIKEFN